MMAYERLNWHSTIFSYRPGLAQIWVNFFIGAASLKEEFLFIYGYLVKSFVIVRNLSISIEHFAEKDNWSVAIESRENKLKLEMKSMQKDFRFSSLMR